MAWHLALLLADLDLCLRPMGLALVCNCVGGPEKLKWLSLGYFQSTASSELSIPPYDHTEMQETHSCGFENVK